jgi:thiol-disulfide isomerase/thioredoxin
MTRRWQLVTLLVASLGLMVSLVVLPPEPFAAPIMAALAETQATLEDREVPAFNLVSTAGEAIPSSTFAGRPTYLTFWAEWCEVCKTEMPSLEAFTRAHGTEVDVLLVTVDENPGAAYRWLAQRFPQGPSFRVLADPGARVANGVFGTTGVPETFVLSPSGRLVARYVGAQEFTTPAHAQLVRQLRRQ